MAIIKARGEVTELSEGLTYFFGVTAGADGKPVPAIAFWENSTGTHQHHSHSAVGYTGETAFDAVTSNLQIQCHVDARGFVLIEGDIRKLIEHAYHGRVNMLFSEDELRTMGPEFEEALGEDAEYRGNLPDSLIMGEPPAL